jgi:hypothetical protein
MLNAQPRNSGSFICAWDKAPGSVAMLFLAVVMDFVLLAYIKI